MSQRITIEIKDKIATCLTESPIVCGNSDYVVDFAFDEEWEKHEVKTAIFVVNGKATEQVFAGNVCPAPVIQNTLIAWVGVFAGTINDGTLSTSTPALVKCIPCITDGGNVPLPPPDDVYNQIIGLIESGVLRGPQGEKGEKGEKGDAGAIKFIPVVRTDKENPIDDLPTENIDESAIYLLPISGEDEQNRFTEYAYIDGKWEVMGAISIQVDHSEYVKFVDMDEQVIESLTANENTLTDEEKASACEWLGAVAIGEPSDSYVRVYAQNQKGTIAKYILSDTLVSNSIPMRTVATKNFFVGTPQDDNECANKGYVDDNLAGKVDKVEYNSTDGSLQGRVYIVDRNNNQTSRELRIVSNYDSIPIRDWSGNFYVGDPAIAYHCANKNYVDNLPDKLTLTDEQKAKWQAWLGTANPIKLYYHCIKLPVTTGGDEIDEERYLGFVSDNPEPITNIQELLYHFSWREVGGYLTLSPEVFAEDQSGARKVLGLTHVHSGTGNYLDISIFDNYEGIVRLISACEQNTEVEDDTWEL